MQSDGEGDSGRLRRRKMGNGSSGKEDNAVGLPVSVKGHWHMERMNALGLDEDTRE